MPIKESSESPVIILEGSHKVSLEIGRHCLVSLEAAEQMYFALSVRTGTVTFT